MPAARLSDYNEGPQATEILYPGVPPCLWYSFPITITITITITGRSLGGCWDLDCRLACGLTFKS